MHAGIDHILIPVHCFLIEHIGLLSLFECSLPLSTGVFEERFSTFFVCVLDIVLEYSL